MLVYSFFPHTIDRQGFGLFDDILQASLQFSLSIASLLMFNSGFRIMRP